MHVDPLVQDPKVIFSNTPVNKVAAYFPKASSMEFIQDPSSTPWKKDGWNVWFAPQLPESAVSDLYAMLGAQAYLVYSASPATVNISGRAIYKRFKWRSDSFNFLGFPVDPVSPPTFKAWFAGSPAHQTNTRPIFFSLDNDGHWVAVGGATTQIQRNTAYWVFCQGGSDYQGPTDAGVTTSMKSGAIDFGDTKTKLVFRTYNTTSLPVNVKLALSSNSSLPITYRYQPSTSLASVDVPLTGALSFGLEALTEQFWYFSLDRSSMTQTSGEALLTISDDVGSYIQLPVTGQVQ